jgi:hypothetical protein
VDLLQIQQDIHPGIFAVMDGTFSGDGPGPRAMRWHETDILLASADQVAIDAISAKLQGFDPLNLPFIRLAHEKEMGVGDPKQIEILGEPDLASSNWGFIQEDSFASRGQKMIYMAGCTRLKNHYYAAHWCYGHILPVISTTMFIGILSLGGNVSKPHYKRSGVNYSNPMGMVRW